jgi:hypothetical protein
MGLFSKAKKGMQDAAGAAEAATAFNQQQAGAQQPGMIGVQGMGPIAADPAIMGGPSTRPLSEDDPLLQPVDGLSLEMYGTAAAEAQRRGITDEDGMATLIEEMHGVPAATAKAALAVWIQRMGQSMVVGQQLRKHMGY